MVSIKKDVSKYQKRYLIKFGSCGQHGAAEPDGKSLHVVRNDLDIDWFGLDPSHGQALIDLQPAIDHSLDVPLKAAVKVPKHGRAARQDNVL